MNSSNRPGWAVPSKRRPNIIGFAYPPNTISGLVGWFEADSTSGTDGANLTTWKDLAGVGDLTAQDGTNVFHASGAGPLSKPYVQFLNGPLYKLSVLVSGSDAARTMFIVSQTSVTATGQVAMIDGDAGAGGFGYSQNENTSSDREVYVAGVGIGSDTTNAMTQNWEKVCVINSHLGVRAGNQRIRVGGSEHTLAVSNNVVLAASGSFSVGGAHGFGTIKFVGGIASVLVWNRVLTPSELLIVEAYLQLKYGC